MQSQHKIALVTGGARRLGHVIALDLAAAGWDVAVHFGSAAEAAERTVAQIRQTGRRSIALQADLSDEAAVDTLIERCATGLGVDGHSTSPGIGDSNPPRGNDIVTDLEPLGDRHRFFIHRFGIAEP